MRRTSLRTSANLFALAAATFAVVAVTDLAAHPASGDRLSGAGSYAFEALLIPYVLLTFAATWQLHRAHDGRDGRLGSAGARVAAIGLLAFLAPAAVTLATGDSDSLGPVYFLAELLSVVGIAMLGVAVAQARLLPAWVGPTLAIGWLLGSPVAEHVTGMALVGAAAFAVCAGAIARQPHETLSPRPTVTV